MPALLCMVVKVINFMKLSYQSMSVSKRIDDKDVTCICWNLQEPIFCVIICSFVSIAWLPFLSNNKKRNKIVPIFFQSQYNQHFTGFTASQLSSISVSQNTTKLLHYKRMPESHIKDQSITYLIFLNYLKMT